MVTVKEIFSKNELRTFVKFKFELYKNSKSWVPPIINQEVKSLDKNENPVFDDAEGRFFLAYKDNKVVGRVAALINWIEVKDQSIKKMRFGWIDFIDDFEVSKALIDKVIEVGKENNLDFIEGPVGFSNLDKVGVVTYGHEHIGNMITWHNHAYYPSHFENLGFQIGKKYSESKMLLKDINPNDFAKIQSVIKKRYKLRVLSFKSNKEILPYADQMFEVFSKSHAALSSFVEINQKQRDYFKKKFLNFLNPEYVKFIVDENDKLISFAIVTPSYSAALQKMNGKLWPFGIFHLLKARKHSKWVTFYLIGILPEYQNKGITAIIFNEFYNEFSKRGITQLYRGPELEDNTAIHQIWRHFKPKIYKRRCTYKKDI